MTIGHSGTVGRVLSSRICDIWVLGVHWRVCGRKGRLLATGKNATVYARYETKENFQTIEGSLCKGPVVREGQSLCKTLYRGRTLGQNVGGRGVNSQPLTSLGKYLAKQSSWTDCPGQAEATPTTRLQEPLSPSAQGVCLQLALGVGRLTLLRH